MKKNQKKSRLLYTAITGASAGIGEATAITMAEKQMPLILFARRLDRLKKLKIQLLKVGAPDVQIFKLDLTQNSDILAWVQKNKSFSIKNLVNSAGLAKGVGHLQDGKPSDWDAMIDTNLKGLLGITRALLPSIIKNKGHIVNLGSVAGRLVYEGGAVYCATKFAVRAINEGLRMDLKGTGVRVTNIEPGMVHTEFSLVRLGNQQKAQAVYDDMVPLSALDVAKSILWVVEQPTHVNIQELVIYPTDQASVGQVVRGEKSVQNLF